MIQHPLHQAIIADPDNDEPRLVFADWFEERGDVARAELIRLQLRLATMNGLHPEWVALKQREQPLLKSHVPTWNADIHRFLQGTVFQGQVKSRHGAIRRWFYQRGFVESIYMDAKALVQSADIVFKLGPLRHLRLYLVRRARHQLPEAEWLGRIRTLELQSDVTNDIVIDLASSPHVQHLRQLSVRNLTLRTTVVRALVESPWLSNLTSLRLEGCASQRANLVSQLVDRFGERVHFHHDDEANRAFINWQQESMPQRDSPDTRSWWHRLLG